MGSTEMANNIYTVNEVARWLRVSDKKIRQMLKDGEIPYIKVGNRYRFVGWQMEKWANQKQKENKK